MFAEFLLKIEIAPNAFVFAQYIWAPSECYKWWKVACLKKSIGNWKILATFRVGHTHREEYAWTYSLAHVRHAHWRRLVLTSFLCVSDDDVFQCEVSRQRTDLISLHFNRFPARGTFHTYVKKRQESSWRNHTGNIFCSFDTFIWLCYKHSEKWNLYFILNVQFTILIYSDPSPSFSTL